MDSTRELIDFGVACFDRWAVKGLATVDVPATPASEPYYAVCIYVADVSSPIMIPYETKEERDTKYEEFKGML
jgi:hypothetical protein